MPRRPGAGRRRPAVRPHRNGGADARVHACPPAGSGHPPLPNRYPSPVARRLRKRLHRVTPGRGDRPPLRHGSRTGLGLRRGSSAHGINEDSAGLAAFACVMSASPSSPPAAATTTTAVAATRPRARLPVRARPSARASPSGATSPARRSRCTPRSWRPRTSRTSTPTSSSRSARAPRSTTRAPRSSRLSSSSGPQRQPAGHGLHAAARPAQHAGRGHRQGRRASPEQVEANVDEFFGPDWKATALVDGKLYAAPLGANVKSFVWYSPTMFEENGWEIPTTWDDMLALSDQIAADGIKPWCAGIGSGEATGWPATDWVEDVVLRDRRRRRLRPVGQPRDPVQRPADRRGPRHGRRDPQERTVRQRWPRRRQEHRDHHRSRTAACRSSTASAHAPPGGFYAAELAEGTEVAEDGDVFAFYLPPIDEREGKPVLGGGEFVAAFADRPRSRRSRPTCPRTPGPTRRPRPTPGRLCQRQQGPWTRQRPARSTGCLGEILQDENAVFRFDGSDLMPGAVGTGSFWKEMTAWITGKDTGVASADRGDLAVDRLAPWPAHRIRSSPPWAPPGAPGTSAPPG